MGDENTDDILKEDIKIDVDVNDIGKFSELAKQYGTHWDGTNEDTLHEWVGIGTYHIRLLDYACEVNRSFLRWNSILGIALSTLTGTLSASQFANVTITTTYTVMLTVFSFLITISSGYMKVYQVQEQLEVYIKIKQEWIDFTTLIISELQLPTRLRRDASYLIWKHKDQYSDLLKKDVDVSSFVRKRIKEPLIYYVNGKKAILSKTHLADILENINDNKNSRKDEIRKVKLIKEKEELIAQIADWKKKAEELRPNFGLSYSERIRDAKYRIKHIDDALIDMGAKDEITSPKDMKNMSISVPQEPELDTDSETTEESNNSDKPNRVHFKNNKINKLIKEKEQTLRAINELETYGKDKLEELLKNAKNKKHEEEINKNYLEFKKRLTNKLSRISDQITVELSRMNMERTRYKSVPKYKLARQSSNRSIKVDNEEKPVEKPVEEKPVEEKLPEKNDNIKKEEEKPESS
jgi:hypothetical protein